MVALTIADSLPWRRQAIKDAQLDTPIEGGEYSASFKHNSKTYQSSSYGNVTIHACYEYGTPSSLNDMMRIQKPITSKYMAR